MARIGVHEPVGPIFVERDAGRPAPTWINRLPARFRTATM